MAKIRVENNTDETLIVEPGETVELNGEEDTIRTMASRTTVLLVNHIRQL